MAAALAVGVAVAQERVVQVMDLHRRDRALRPGSPMGRVDVGLGLRAPILNRSPAPDQSPLPTPMKPHANVPCPQPPEFGSP